MDIRTHSSSPDTILYNAQVYTVDPDQPQASAVAVRSGEIAAVGDSDDLLRMAGANTKLLDMERRLMLPGFCDAHIHFYDWSLAQAEVNLAATRSRAEMLAIIQERSRVLDEHSWVIGRGWNESWWGDTEYPQAADVDTVTGSAQPAIFWRTDLHTAVVNSHALTLAGITSSTPDPIGGVIERDSAGAPNGILKELAIAMVADLIPPATIAQTKDAMCRGTRSLHRLGITAIHDQRMKGHNDGIAALTAYQELYESGELSLRVNCNFAAHQLPHLEALGLSYGFGNRHLRFGHVKVFADGSLGSQTALMDEPFLKLSPNSATNTGVRLTELDEIMDQFRAAADIGFPMSVHAIGDRANREILDIFEELQGISPAPRVPHRIEHVQIIHSEDIGRLVELGITASVQPVHVLDDIEIAEQLLGERCVNLYNFRSLLDSGALVAFGSDAPVADPNPFLGIHAAIARQKPSNMSEGSWYGDEGVSLQQAIFAYTMGPALASGWQHDIGSITVGKCADVIVLDRDLFELTRSQVVGDEIAGTQVDLTMFNGEVVHNQI